MEIIDYIMSEKLVLIPVLYIIGYFISNTGLIRNKFIPFILLGLGIIFSLLIGGDTILNNIIQGILVAGTTVLTNQMIKQSNKIE